MHQQPAAGGRCGPDNYNDDAGGGGNFLKASKRLYDSTVY